MATIGKVILALEAQSAAFTRGCHEAVSAVHEVGEAAESIKSILETAFAFAGLEMGIGGLKEMVMHTMEATASTYRLSGALGITTASLQALQTAGLLGAGIQADEFNGILQKMVKSLGTAGDAGGPAAAALHTLGISGSDLKGQHLDQTFEQIADKIHEIKDPTEQARVATELFGKEGQKLLPLFQQGAEGIREAREENDRLGISLTELDAAKVMVANEQMEKIGLAVTGIENRFTVALAPVLTAIAEKIVSLVPPADKMQSAFMSAFKIMTEGVGYAIDAWNVLKLAGQGVSSGIVASLELVVIAVKKLAEATIYVANLFGAGWKLPEFFNNVESQVDGWRQELQKEMNETIDSLKQPNSEKWGKFFDELQAKADETAKNMEKLKPMSGIANDFEIGGDKIQSILDELQKQVDEFGMSKAQKEVQKLKDAGDTNPADIARAESLANQLDTLEKQKKITEDIAKLQKEAAQVNMTEAEKKLDDLKTAGASDEQLKQATELQEHIDAMKKWKEEQKDANKLIEESMSPIDKYQKKLDDIQKLYHDGLLSEAQADDAVLKAYKDFHKDEKKDDVKAETRRFDFRMPNDSKQNDAKQALLLAKQQLDSQKMQEFYQQQLYQFGLDDQQNADAVWDF